MSMSWMKANAVLDAELANGTPYLWLHVGDPGASGSANVAQTDVPADIVRKAITMGEAEAGTGEQVSTNTVAVEWTGAQIDDSQEISYFSIWDALTEGNCLFIADVDTPKTTGSDGVTIGIDDLEVALSVYLVEPA